MADYSLIPAPPDSAHERTRRPAGDPRRIGRAVVRVLLALLVVAVIVAAALAARVAAPAWSGYRAANALLVEAEGGLGNMSPVIVTARLAEANRALDDVARNLRPLHPLLRALEWLPTWGSTAAATPELLALAQPLTNLAGEAAPLLGAAQKEGDLLARVAALASALAAEPDRLERMAADARAASVALAAVPVDELHPALASRLHQVAPLLERLPDLIPALPGLPTLLGMEEPHSLLVLVQNNHELRATGGFISAVGRVTLDKGKVVEMDFADSYSIFRPDATDYPPAPAPLLRFMDAYYLTFRDANWSPDLSTTARIAGALYRQDTGADFDDVVTIDLDAVQLLVEALSPITLEGVDEPVTGDNIIEIMKELWARPTDSEATVTHDAGKWWQQRKDFIPKLAQAALHKALNGGDPLRLASALLTALDRRSVQLATGVEPVAAALAAQNWDGNLMPGPKGSDFLALVDSNLGFNKVNAVVTRTLAYTLTLPVDGVGPALAEVSVTWTHPITTPDPGCALAPRYGLVYDDMIARCYFVYPRLYVPGGSTLLEMTGVTSDTVTSRRGEAGTQVFAGYLVVPTNSSATVTWRYEVAESVILDVGSYRLVLQRQSGTQPLPVTLRVGEQSDALVVEAGRVVWGVPE